MHLRIARFTRALTQTSVRHPWAILAAFCLIIGFALGQIGKLRSEVGYPAYFGPNDARVRHLTAFLEEFESGLHVVIAVGCQDGRFCETATEPRALDLIGRLQRDVDRLPNVRRTWSLLNTPILVGPLETRTLATRRSDGQYVLDDGWADLARRAPAEPFLANAVISRDARTAGVVVELQSLESSSVRELVHGIMNLRAPYEVELGGEIFVAGDPAWTVLSSDDLDRDSMNLSALMIAVMLGVLWFVFRDLRLVLLPVIAVAAVAVSTYGLVAVSAIPLTAIIAAIPPLLVVIGTAATMHFITAFLRSEARVPAQALIEAAQDVGAGAFWCAVTTAAGFASFLWSDLQIFREFGLVAVIGVLCSFVVIFTVIPSLICLSMTRSRPARRESELVTSILGVAHDAAFRRPRLVLFLGLALLGAFALGVRELRYASDVGFGEHSFIMRSVRFIEANFRKPMTTELVLTVPRGARVYDEGTLRILDRIERYFDAEPSTGFSWSLLDFIGEVYRIDHGAPAGSFEALLAAAPGEMPIVAAIERTRSFWSEASAGDSGGRQGGGDRLRISVDRAWLDDTVQGPYLERVRGFVDELNREIAPQGYHAELEGGLVLAELAVHEIRSTQWGSFTSAFLSVSVIFLALLWGSWTLVFWAVIVNVLPVFSLLGLMGWVGIGIEPANAMVAAILLGIVVDDTIHLTLQIRRLVQAGVPMGDAVVTAFKTVGEAVVITSLCLSLGFSMLMFSRWAGLASFGLLASLGIIVALIAELLLLPAALLSWLPQHRTGSGLDVAA